MYWFWKPTEEILTQNQRALNKVMRDLDRERAHLENNEKNVIMDIKNIAKMGRVVILFFKRVTIKF